MPRLKFDAVKNGTNPRKHGISLERFGDMDFDVALVAEDVATTRRWKRDGSTSARLIACCTSGSSRIAAMRRESSACAARAAMNGSSMSKRTDDPENPELGVDFFARAQRGLDHVPGPMQTA
jgi:uncharacterized DUF497 family protein